MFVCKLKSRVLYVCVSRVLYVSVTGISLCFAFLCFVCMFHEFCRWLCHSSLLLYIKHCIVRFVYISSSRTLTFNFYHHHKHSCLQNTSHSPSILIITLHSPSILIIITNTLVWKTQVTLLPFWSSSRTQATLLPFLTVFFSSPP